MKNRAEELRREVAGAWRATRRGAGRGPRAGGGVRTRPCRPGCSRAPSTHSPEPSRPTVWGQGTSAALGAGEEPQSCGGSALRPQTQAQGTSDVKSKCTRSAYRGPISEDGSGSWSGCCQATRCFGDLRGELPRVIREQETQPPSRDWSPGPGSCRTWRCDCRGGTRAGSPRQETNAPRRSENEGGSELHHSESN